MGVPCIKAEYPYEAEAVATSLVIHGHADYVGSEDTICLFTDDAIAKPLTACAGCSCIRSASPAQLDQPQHATIHHIWHGSPQCTAAQSFVNFALLLGTNFTQRIKSLGPHTAIKLIRPFGSTKKVMEGQTKYVPETPSTFLEQIAVACMVFSTLPPVLGNDILQAGPYGNGDVQAILKEYKVGVADLVEHASEGTMDIGHNYFWDDPMDPGGAYRGWISATV
jgi:flap endonuclease-1